VAVLLVKVIKVKKHALADSLESVLRVAKCLFTEDLERSFEAGDVVTREALIEKGVINSRKSLVGHENLVIKILGDGELTKKLTVVANSFSEKASQIIVKCGGEARLNKEI